MNGTLVGNVMYSGDDADLWHLAGYDVVKCDVMCSKRVAHGEQWPNPRRHMLVAIDRNGRTPDDIRDMLSGVSDTARIMFSATGHFNGETSASVVCVLRGDEICRAHWSLRAALPGFECFAVLDNQRVMRGVR